MCHEQVRLDFLKRLRQNHNYLEDLKLASSDGDLWKRPFIVMPNSASMKNEIDRRLKLAEQKTMQPFVVIDNKNNKAIGMTTYCHLFPTNRRLDIGWTWYRQSYHKTFTNTETKLLLLTYAFETLKCIAVGFRVDPLNRPSQNAVLRIGAQYEGKMRNYSIMPDGTIRDILLYSITVEEWPRIKSLLNYYLKQYWTK